VAHAGFEGIEWTGLNKTVIAIFLSPMLGMLLAMLVMLVSSWALHRATAKFAEKTFRRLHLLSSAAYSVSHGLNDAQKTMGIIAVLLYSTGYLQGEFHVPHWVAFSCYVAIALGTLSGGWKIIETMGGRITKLSHHQGFAASTGGSIIGAGVTRRASAVRWGVASNVVAAWFITIPASAIVAAAFYGLTRLF
jgi:PiT family inorganic phosphate transporter